MTPNRFKQYRVLAYKTQAQYAELLGVNVRTVQRYESGEIVVPLTVAKLVEYISVHDGASPTTTSGHQKYPDPSHDVSLGDDVE